MFLDARAAKKNSLENMEEILRTTVVDAITDAVKKGRIMAYVKCRFEEGREKIFQQVERELIACGYKTKYWDSSDMWPQVIWDDVKLMQPSDVEQAIKKKG
jgi:ribosome maturation protein Sdo1